MKTIEQVMSEFTPARRKKIEEGAKVLIEEEYTIQELRKAHKRNQKNIKRKLGINRDEMIDYEEQSDLLLSSLQKTINKLGGKLSFTMEFPDKRTITFDAEELFKISDLYKKRNVE